MGVETGATIIGPVYGVEVGVGEGALVAVGIQAIAASGQGVEVDVGLGVLVGVPRAFAKRQVYVVKVQRLLPSAKLGVQYQYPTHEDGLNCKTVWFVFCYY